MNSKIAASQPMVAKATAEAKAKYIKYTPAQQNPMHNSGARYISMLSIPVYFSIEVKTRGGYLGRMRQTFLSLSSLRTSFIFLSCLSFYPLFFYSSVRRQHPSLILPP